MPLTLGVSRKKAGPLSYRAKPVNKGPDLPRPPTENLPILGPPLSVLDVACCQPYGPAPYALRAARASPWFSFPLRGKGKVIGRCPTTRKPFEKCLIENFFPLRAVLIKHGADALVGEQLHQDGVGRPPVDDVGPAHAPAHRVHATVDLGDHAAGDDALFL